MTDDYSANRADDTPFSSTSPESPGQADEPAAAGNQPPAPSFAVQWLSSLFAHVDGAVRLRAGDSVEVVHTAEDIDAFVAAHAGARFDLETADGRLAGFALVFADENAAQRAWEKTLHPSVVVLTNDAATVIAVYLTDSPATAEEVVDAYYDSDEAKGFLGAGTAVPMPIGEFRTPPESANAVRDGAVTVYDEATIRVAFLPEHTSTALGPKDFPRSASFQDAALAYAERGFKVFPIYEVIWNRKTGKQECACMAGKRRKAKLYCEPVQECTSKQAGKHGTVDSWKRRATTDADVIKNWAQRWPGANVGIATGPDSGFWVLDIDGEVGEQTLAKLVAKNGSLPATVETRTGSGGRHIWFRYPEGVKLSISANGIGSKLDMRGDGGYIVAPPSTHYSGGVYKFISGHRPDDVPLAPAPDWLVALAATTAADRRKAPEGRGVSGSMPLSDRGPSATSTAHAGASRREGAGFAYYLSLIGDNEGQEGFDAPIYSAANSWFSANGVEANEAPLKERLLEAIRNAFEDPKRPRRARYLSDEYLDHRIEQARDYIRANGGGRQGQPDDNGSDADDRRSPEMAACDAAGDGGRTKAEVLQALLEAVNAFTPETPEFDRRVIWYRAARAGLSKPDEGRIREKFKEKTRISKADIRAEAESAAKSFQRETLERERAARGVVTVEMEGGSEPAIREVWSAVEAGNVDKPALFQTDLGIVRVVRTLGAKGENLEVMNRARLKDALRRWVVFSSERDPDGFCPDEIADVMMAQGEKPLPFIAGVVRTPFYAPNESGDPVLISTTGYNAPTGYYYASSGLVLPEVPDCPSHADMVRAKSFILDNLLIDFPFRDSDGRNKASRTHALALMLQFLVRPLIDGPTPIFYVSKGQPRTGASFLIGSILLTVTGAVGEPQGEIKNDDNEVRKNITSALDADSSYYWVDNIIQPIDSGIYANAVTARRWTDRRLGRSEKVSLPVRLTWIFSGNNVGASGEITHRCIPIRLEAPGDPTDRKPEDFRHYPLTSWVRSNRAELVAALLVLVNYWIALGARSWKGKALAGFDEWSGIIGGILTAIEMPGFMENLAELHASANEEDTAWRMLVQAWVDRDGLDRKADIDDAAGGLVQLIETMEISIAVRGLDDSAKGRSFRQTISRKDRSVHKVVHNGVVTTVRICRERPAANAQWVYWLERAAAQPH